MMKIAIIGGGAAGLVGAVLCAREGFSVCIYERGERGGRKLLASGNGQCNIDNYNASLQHYHGANRNFAKEALRLFDTKENIKFWESIGVDLVEKEKGKLYPRSLQAAAVVDLLRLSCQNLNVEEKTNTEIVQIKKEKGKFCLTDQGGNRYFADKVIVATGGSAASASGGSESGYQLLKKAGHRVYKPLPAIVQLKTLKANKALSGQKINARVTLFADQKKLRSEEGEILFTDYGLSGVPVLQVSALAARALDEGKTVEIALDLVDNMTKEALYQYLFNRRDTLGHLTLEHFLSGFLPKRIAQQILKEALGVALSMKAEDLTEEDLMKIVQVLKEKREIVNDTMGLKNAQATLGGVATDDFNAETMESYLMPGVYGVGEVLDICGDCGGFNLHWATSSVQLAVKAIKEERESR